MVFLVGAWFAGIGAIGWISYPTAMSGIFALPAITFGLWSIGTLFPLLDPDGPGALWLTPTSLVDESAGFRVELRYADINSIHPVPHMTRVIVITNPGAPRPYHRRWSLYSQFPYPHGVTIVRTEGMPGGAIGMASTIAARAAEHQNIEHFEHE